VISLLLKFFASCLIFYNALCPTLNFFFFSLTPTYCADTIEY
jgi:hypothetical protein